MQLDTNNLLERPMVMLLVGKPGRGKSNTIKYMILRHTVDKPIYKFGIVFTRTKFNDDYNYVDERFVFDNYDEEVLRNYLDTIEKYKKKTGESPRNFVIFDDMIGLLSKFDPFLTNFFGTHRHFGSDIYLATQHLNTGANTSLREVTTYLIAFSSKQKNTIESLYENFGQLFDHINEFKQHFFEQTKEPYTAMIYDNRNEELIGNYAQFRAPDMSNVNISLRFGNYEPPEKPVPEEARAVNPISGRQAGQLLKMLGYGL